MLMFTDAWRWLDVESAEGRSLIVVKEFEEFLYGKDIESTKAVILLPGG